MSAMHSSNTTNGITIDGCGSAAGNVIPSWVARIGLIEDGLYFVCSGRTIPFLIMDVRFECPNCQQRIKVDDSAAGMQIECPNCHNQLTVPVAAPASATPAARVLPKLRQEAPAAEPTQPELPPPEALGKPKGKGKGAQYRCNNPRCGAILFESQLLAQTVQGRASQVCPKCRMAVTKVAEASGFFSRLFKKK